MHNPTPQKLSDQEWANDLMWLHQIRLEEKEASQN